MMRKLKLCIWIPVMTLIFLIGCRTSQPSAGRIDCETKIPLRAEDICPILIGQPLPKIFLRTPDNELFNLNSAIAKKPTVLIFFRGGWCPYCNRHLNQLQNIEPDLIKLGFQIIAVSPDRPGLLKSHAKEKEINYLLMSDSTMKAAEALGIAFQVDDETIKKYSTYGIDLQASSGQNHHLLPVPAVFIIGKDGVIQFSYVNPNYKVRIDSGVLLKAAEAVANQPPADKL